jgi:hypothetical protein
MDSKDISFLCQLLSTLLRTRVEQTKMDQIQLKELDNSFIEFENQEEKLLQSREVPELNFEIWERERGNSTVCHFVSRSKTKTESLSLLGG